MARYLRAKEAAQQLGVAAQTMARWRVEGSPIPWSKVGRSVVYSLDDIEAYVESRKVRAGARADERTTPSTSSRSAA